MKNMTEVNPQFETGAAIHEIYEKQTANRWRVAQTGAAERIEKLKRLKAALWSRREEMHQALHDDFRKNSAETDLTEIYPCIAEINHTVKHLASWMRPRRVKTPLMLFGTSSAIHYEPKGLVLILSPWNYPINLCINPLVAAVAAGNCAIVKPSSKVPHASRFLKRLLSGVFPEDEVALVEGSSAVSNALLELKFDHIFFTGSPGIGKSVMRAAAAHLTPVTLELGGKSPAVVDAAADVERAAERILWGKFLNAGQTCVAPDYLLIHESLHDAFVEASRRILQKRYGETAELRRSSDSFCRLVSKDHCAKLKQILDESVAQGAVVAFGGGCDPADRYLEPTLLTGVTEGSPIMREEIFGPILPVMTFKNLDEPVRFIQSMEKPLALYLFSRSGETVDRIMKSTTSGGACVNALIVHLANPDLPFGGVGQSGMGSYHGLHGFRNLSHERAVLTQKFPDTLKMFYPPYTEKIKKLIPLATRYFG